jgi:zinc D-Ala-D-Ala dipeptidase
LRLHFGKASPLEGLSYRLPFRSILERILCVSEECSRTEARVRIRFLLVVCGLFVSVAVLRAQTDSVLLPGPKPADVSAEWKQLAGIYRRDGTMSALILESDKKLFWVETTDQLDVIVGSSQFEIHISRSKPPAYSVSRGEHGDSPFAISYAPNGAISGLTIGEDFYRRTDAGADPEHFFHIKPAKPIEQLRAAALAAQPPDEAGPFRKPDLVELAGLDASIHLDVRYAQSNNFLSTPVYTQARAFLQRPAAEALLRVARELQPLGYGLLIHDAYRPWYVTRIFWDATPAADHIFVADPQKGSRHNRGCAVDLTLYDLASGKPVEMPGLYDEMSPRSFPTFSGGTSLQRWHRDLLRRAMELQGFTVNENEWWHFDYKDWKYYPILNVPLEGLGSAAPSS